VKEREAVTTIMEQKIKVLVQSVAQSVASVVSHNPQLGGSEPGVALSKDLVALQRLVGASIAALKNAAASGDRGGDRGGAGSAPVTPSGPSGMRPRPQGPPPSQQGLGYGQSQGERPLSQSVDSGMPRYGSSNSMGGLVGGVAGASALGTPISLPAFPTQGRAPSAGAAPQGGWGGKDEYYSSGDVYRSVDRK